MTITARVEGLSSLTKMQRVAKRLGSPAAMKGVERGLIDAGRKTKTQVQRAVHRQMATRSYSDVVERTRGASNHAALSYVIFSPSGGLPITEYRGLRSQKSGRLAPGMSGLVSSGVWNAPRTFKRSFTAGSGFYAMLPGDREVAPRILWRPGAHPEQKRDGSGRFADMGRTYGPVRRLFGPALREELVKDDSLATFNCVAPVELERHVGKRIAKLMKW